MKKIKSLNGKRVLITGATGGIGSVLARRLLQREGARLILVDRETGRLRELKDSLNAEFKEQNPQIEIFEADLASLESIQGLVRSIGDGELDVLINNAGIVITRSLAKMDLQDAEAHIDVNLLAVIRLTRLLLPKLLERDRAFIVNVASGAGLAGPGGLSAYAASKFGVVGFSEALRTELWDHNVGVSVVCPAFVKTDIIKNSARKSAGGDAGVEKLDQVVKKMGVTPEKVAKRIIKAIKRNRGVVIISAWSRMVLVTRFFSPRLAGWFSRVVYRKMKKKGVIE
jgi:short-subunit dehydrogenase